VEVPLRDVVAGKHPEPQYDLLALAKDLAG
jgi:hypothetical protein